MNCRSSLQRSLQRCVCCYVVYFFEFTLASTWTSGIVALGAEKFDQNIVLMLKHPERAEGVGVPWRFSLAWSGHVRSDAGFGRAFGALEGAVSLTLATQRPLGAAR